MAETPMLRAPRRAKNILNRLIAAKSITPEGLRWLEIATDPFHDTDISCDGYPDNVSTRSITQCVTKQITMATPASPGVTWDLHVFFVPLSPTFSQDLPPVKMVKQVSKDRIERPNSSRKQCADADDGTDEDDDPFRAKKKTKSTSGSSYGYYRTGFGPDGNVNQTPFNNTIFPGWNCIAVPTGDDWLSDAGITGVQVALPQDYSSGSYRLIGTGCEVHNTTAELYKGGSVTCYRSPCPGQRATTSFMDGAGANHFQSAVLGVMPPTTLDQATLYPNSRTWEASEGVYLIPTLNSSDNPYYTPVCGDAGIIVPRSVTDLENGTGWLGFYPDINNSQPVSSLSTLFPWDVSGAVFTGLNANSTLTVTTRYYIERHPTIADPNLLVLSHPPCPYDPTIIEIYSRCMAELPVGVKVSENPLGEWFTEVLDGIAEYAPMIGKAVGNFIPGGAIIGNAIGGGAKMIRGFVPQPSKEVKTITQGKKGKKTTTVVTKTQGRTKNRKKKKKAGNLAVANYRRMNSVL